MDHFIRPIVLMSGVFFCVAPVCVRYIWYRERLTPDIKCMHRFSMFSTFVDFLFSVVTLNSSLYYQIFEFDTNIVQILVGIIGSTYREGKFWKQSWNVNTEQQACNLPLPEIHIGL